MIGKLTGKVDQIFNDHIILDVMGVGYITYCSLYTISSLKKGDTRSLLITSQTKDDGTTLFGFIDIVEKNCFQHLLSVQGIGGRMAMTILGILTTTQLLESICTKLPQVLETVPGVGPKLARRIITELSCNKQLIALFESLLVDQAITTGDTELVVASAAEGKVPLLHNNVANDAIAALVNLGFNKQIVINIVSTIMTEQNSIALPELIRLALSKVK